MSDAKPSIYPINQAFLDYLESIKQDKLITTADSGYHFGVIPPIVEAPKYQVNLNKSMAFPSSYDLRSEERVTPVKNQNPLGTCWAFAACGSLESNLLPEEYTDLSENHLVMEHGFSVLGYYGGNYDMSTAYFTRWGGPMNESDDPYTGIVHNPPPGIKPIKHVQEIRFLPPRQNADYLDSVKYILMNHGAIDSTFLYNPNYYNSETDSYYYNIPETPENPTNHEVAIIGWNDNYNSSNFTITPPGNGAFLIKNSWGSDRSYFYISYYDANITARAAYTVAEAVNNFKDIYQYDMLGRLGYVYFENTSSIWMSNIFTATSDNPITAVSFYTTMPGTICTIKIYTNCSGTPNSGLLAATKTFTSDILGYQTVRLDNRVPVTNGTKFSIVVLLTVPNGNISYVATEYKQEGYSDAVTINPGESFFSWSESDWIDLVGLPPCGNVCLKAFTSETIPPVTTATLSGSLGSNGWYVSNVSVTLTAEDGDGSGVAVTKYSFDNVNWSIYNSPILISNEGTTELYFYSIDTEGNTETPKMETIKIDKNQPQITIAVPADGASYPLNSAINANWSVTDLYSGIADSTGTVPSGDPIDTTTVGQKTFSVYAVDMAGNETTQVVSYYVTETTPPVTTADFSGDPGSNNWYLSDVVVTLTAQDSDGSGVAVTNYKLNNDNWSTYNGPIVISSEGTTELYFYSIDTEGNTETPKMETIKIDKNQPQIAIAVPADGASYTLNAVVIADWSASDEISGIATANGTVLSGEPFDTSTVGTKTFSVHAVDNAGNGITKQVSYFVTETTPPVTTASFFGDTGNNGWYISDVTVTLTANDIATLKVQYSNAQGPVITKYSFDDISWFIYSTPIVLGTEGNNKLYFHSMDALGNTEPKKMITINIDKSKPQIQINVPVNGANYLLNSVVSAAWSAADAFSGVDTAAGTVPSGDPIDTSTVGTKTFSVHAIDKAGNDITQEVTYNVIDQARGVFISYVEEL